MKKIMLMALAIVLSAGTISTAYANQEPKCKKECCKKCDSICKEKCSKEECSKKNEARKCESKDTAKA